LYVIIHKNQTLKLDLMSKITLKNNLPHSKYENGKFNFSIQKEIKKWIVAL